MLMSMDVFVHTCFGVVLEGDALTALQAAYDKAEADLRREDEDWAIDLTSGDEVSFIVDRIPSEVLAEIREAVGAPSDASVIWTDSEDDRLGRCATEARAWVVGYGPFPFLEQVQARWAQGKPVPELQSWATGG